MGSRQIRNAWLVAVLAIGISSYAQAELASLTVEASGKSADYIAEGIVEAVHDTQLASQMPGRITSLSVRAGEPVNAGQELARVDQRIAAEQMAASRALLAAARADYERQRTLFEKQYISQAAMDRAEAQYKALRAQANSATTQSGLHVIVAPYAGVIATVPVAVGDMAMPGKPLMTMYDPRELRVSVNVPESIAGKLVHEQAAGVDIPAAAGARITVTTIDVLPTRDAGAHTAVVRLPLSGELAGVRPGQFARARLPTSDGEAPTLMIPRSAVLQRAEFNAVYVIDAQGNPQLRQVRLGPAEETTVEVLAGLDAGERIALDPRAAARLGRSQ